MYIFNIYLCYYSYYTPHKPPTALLSSLVVTTAHLVLPHPAVIPLNHTVSTTGRPSLSAQWLPASRKHLSNMTPTLSSVLRSHTLATWAKHWRSTEVGKTMQFVWCEWDVLFSWNLLLQQALCLLWELEEHKRGGGVKEEEEEEEEEVEENEERVGRNVRTLRANKLRMCRGHYFSFLGATLTPLESSNCEQGPLMALDSLQTAL